MLFALEVSVLLPWVRGALAAPERVRHPPAGCYRRVCERSRTRVEIFPTQPFARPHLSAQGGADGASDSIGHIDCPFTLSWLAMMAVVGAQEMSDAAD